MTAQRGEPVREEPGVKPTDVGAHAGAIRGEAVRGEPGRDNPARGEAGGGTDRTISVRQVLDQVKDPEIPAVSICELGMVHRVEDRDGITRVELLPTYVGCPALDWIRREVARALRAAGVAAEVVFVHEVPWTPQRITPAGIEKLRGLGIAMPVGEDPRIAPHCPYCGAEGAQVENLFGPTPCRAVFYCRRCRQPFEGFKP
ncbi:1,2-phenylacetyl-CoA epoxidase subunit PaaD [Alicyclobacillus sp.]|uniref:1,2-phenylacetyl-CoA epoxidase subunit PaaD n=1 Tax=Alicyclobacillus sp. TaxID=61169 RepID=UPI0025BF2C87|nr:1,2-phenylacetyl-CoA epoxidase subunit PaaD [Alicyclobacillus sp.]MCL6517272.1 phenylacetate-CoA oxygenase subunit PaaJ [Alicyclobacillus sp.]